MSMIGWDLLSPRGPSPVQKFDHHSEFVVGIDFNLFQEGMVAACSWDDITEVFHLANGPLPILPL